MPNPSDKVAEPKQKDPVTSDQIASAINIGKFDGAKADKAWHQGIDGGGQFEPWSMQYGYKDGYPLYGGVLVGDKRVHIYYLANTSQTILLNAGEEPKNYKS